MVGVALAVNVVLRLDTKSWCIPQADPSNTGNMDSILTQCAVYAVSEGVSSQRMPP
jgi:hypothetical protein